MFRRSMEYIVVFILLVAVSCASGGPKLGTGGTSIAKQIEKTDHPAYPDGVSCYVCHKSEIPSYEFHRGFGNRCEQCHVETTWMAKNYPHTEWPLNEIHRVRCTRCHVEASKYNFKVYRCWGCHHTEEDIRKSHANLNAPHLMECAGCHTGFGE
ncbi:MAG: hypothetical protein J7M24_00895 [Candidatus Latescibacteria bacterium]|nr:hypothetical protein [Candidatus Latescibacterota bacterium]